jgi:hypothetical protein
MAWHDNCRPLSAVAHLFFLDLRVPATFYVASSLRLGISAMKNHEEIVRRFSRRDAMTAKTV